LEVIREVGHGGHFLDHDHTARHFREELFFPRFFERMSVEQWIDRGAKSTLEVAHEEVAEILSKTKPIKLPEGAGAALEQTLQNALSEIEMI
jgi:trimethylamine--corrinoid protein Co-methyltransferase